MVTSVKPIPGVPNTAKEYGWLVQGYESETDQPFEYRCKRVVLATGTTDSSNRLGVSGEETYNWVTHEFKDFERKLDRSNSPLSKCIQYHHLSHIQSCISPHLNKESSPKGTSLQINDQYDSDDLKPGIEPVLIIGSGLSAADAIMAARFRGISVIHVFRNNPNKADKKKSLDKIQWLPASMYPEYHKVYEMMGDRGRHYPLYKSLPDHVVVDFSVGADKYTRTKTRLVTLCTPQGRLVSYRVSFAAVFIGE